MVGVNEKVSMEVAIGASIAGARAGRHEHGPQCGDGSAETHVCGANGGLVVVTATSAQLAE